MNHENIILAIVSQIEVKNDSNAKDNKILDKLCLHWTKSVISKRSQLWIKYLSFAKKTFFIHNIKGN